jgi:hypothetical protein
MRIGYEQWVCRKNKAGSVGDATGLIGCLAIDHP